MSISYELRGRKQQKARTREALIQSTRRLLAAGRTPTVEQTAEAASISRATAYRYFPNQRSLLVAAHPEIETTSLLREGDPDDPEARFHLAVDRLTRIVAETEPELRTMLRLSLDRDGAEGEDLLLRQGRALEWLEDALTPLRGRLSTAARRRLALATRSACGIEALVWLTDVAGLSREDAVEVMRWSGRALLDGALAEEAAGGRR